VAATPVSTTSGGNTSQHHQWRQHQSAPPVAATTVSTTSGGNTSQHHQWRQHQSAPPVAATPVSTTIQQHHWQQLQGRSWCLEVTKSYAELMNVVQHQYNILCNINKCCVKSDTLIA
jgi:hypothetical protein